MHFVQKFFKRNLYNVIRQKKSFEVKKKKKNDINEYKVRGYALRGKNQSKLLLLR